MSTTVDALLLDLLDWVGPDKRPYSEVGPVSQAPLSPGQRDRTSKTQFVRR